MSESAKRIDSKISDAFDTGSICYGKDEHGWWIYLPKCGVGYLSGHTVEEHEDGTITASPSIMMTGHDEGAATTRHGFLRRGVWEEC